MDKPCNECKLKLPLSNFYKRAGNTDGYSNLCKKCFNNKKKNTNIKCGYCNNIFIGRINSKFCSKTCLNLYKTGKIGKNAVNFKGGKIISSHGYIRICSIGHPKANKRGHYVYEHILVIEKKIGRYLKNNEVVHHINGIKTDNRLKNLMLFKNNKEHLKYHYEQRKKTV